MFDAVINQMFCGQIHGLISPSRPHLSSDFSMPVRKARLPKSLGGGGLTSLQDLRHPAYLASLAQSWKFLPLSDDSSWKAFRGGIADGIHVLGNSLRRVSCDSAYFPSTFVDANYDLRVARLRELCELNPVELQADKRVAFTALAKKAEGASIQRALTHIGHGYRADKLILDTFQQHSRRAQATPQLGPRSSRVALLISSMCSEACSWHHCMPLEMIPGNHITPEEYKVLLAFHYNQPLPGRSLLGGSVTSSANISSSVSCPRNRNHVLDKYGHHLFTCWSNRSRAHNKVRDLLHSFCVNAGVHAVTEPTGILRNLSPDSDRRPDLAIEGAGGESKDLLVDVVTVDPGALSSMRAGASHKVILGAAKHATNVKTRSYRGHVNTATHAFLPAAVELTGRWSPELHRLVGKIKAVGALRRGSSSTLDATAAKLKFTWWREALSVGFARSLAKAALTLKEVVLDRLSSSGADSLVAPLELAFC